MFKRLMRDPLVHFLFAGIGIFILLNHFGQDSNNSENTKRIVVDRQIMLQQLQYLTKVFEPAAAARRLDKLSEKELTELMGNYIRDEVLYREAKAYGFGENDFIIKKRMIQKMDFITEGISEAIPVFSDDDIRKYYEANRSQYLQPASITFSHIFYSSKERNEDIQLQLAKTKLDELQQINATFNDAPAHGERFPFGTNYVERTFEEISDHFGPAMAKILFELQTSENWQGPFLSNYGSHLIMLSKHQQARVPPLTEISGQVVADLQADYIRNKKNSIINEIIGLYIIDVQQPIQLTP